jgi:hypothetical protein
VCVRARTGVGSELFCPHPLAGADGRALVVCWTISEFGSRGSLFPIDRHGGLVSLVECQDTRRAGPDRTGESALSCDWKSAQK